MGHVTVEAKLTSSTSKQTIIAESIVYTGATFTTIPQTISRKLKLPAVAKRKVRTTNRKETLTESYLIIEILNEKPPPQFS